MCKQPCESGSKGCACVTDLDVAEASCCAACGGKAAHITFHPLSKKEAVDICPKRLSERSESKTTNSTQDLILAELQAIRAALELQKPSPVEFPLLHTAEGIWPKSWAGCSASPGKNLESGLGQAPVGPEAA